MTVALRVEKVSKQYRIYERPGDRLKESLTRGMLRRHKEFWALRDVDFEIESGKTVGIVGPNGCGKSTLLQIISGTLAPTHGDVWHEGRIAALLELGAGFDSMGIYVCPGATAGDRPGTWWIYYLGTDIGHDQTLAKGVHNSGGFGRFLLGTE